MSVVSSFLPVLPATWSPRPARSIIRGARRSTGTHRRTVAKANGSMTRAALVPRLSASSAPARRAPL